MNQLSNKTTIFAFLIIIGGTNLFGASPYSLEELRKSVEAVKETNSFQIAFYSRMESQQKNLRAAFNLRRGDLKDSEMRSKIKWKLIKRQSQNIENLPNDQDFGPLANIFAENAGLKEKQNKLKEEIKRLRQENSAARGNTEELQKQLEDKSSKLHAARQQIEFQRRQLASQQNQLEDHYPTFAHTQHQHQAPCMAAQPDQYARPETRSIGTQTRRYRHTPPMDCYNIAVRVALLALNDSSDSE